MPPPLVPTPNKLLLMINGDLRAPGCPAWWRLCLVVVSAITRVVAPIITAIVVVSLARLIATIGIAALVPAIAVGVVVKIMGMVGIPHIRLVGILRGPTGILPGCEIPRHD
jgi:hypothetical protein